MSVSSRSQLGPEQQQGLQPVSSFYGNNAEVGEIVADIDDEVIVRRDQDSRFISDNERHLTDRFSEAWDRATVSAKQTARQVQSRAQQSARSTAQTAREHPGMAAAVIGGLATAAIAGIGLYTFRKREAELAPQRFIAPKRKVSVSKVASKKKG